tara:strand:+ start:5427 stop:5876 length:450 start_codon:yes stop_codon:yes gene_type:complete
MVDMGLEVRQLYHDIFLALGASWCVAVGVVVAIWLLLRILDWCYRGAENAYLAFEFARHRQEFKRWLKEREQLSKNDDQGNLMGDNWCVLCSGGGCDHVWISPPRAVEKEYDDLRFEVTGNMDFKQKIAIATKIKNLLNQQPKGAFDSE